MSRDVTRTCAACGRPLSWWMSGTWLNQMLHCGRCRRSASRTRPPMTRSEKWSWVRHEAIVVGVVALAVCGLLRSGTVHFGPPPPDDAPYMHEYRGALTARRLGRELDRPGLSVDAGLGRELRTGRSFPPARANGRRERLRCGWPPARSPAARLGRTAYRSPAPFGAVRHGAASWSELRLLSLVDAG